MRILFLTNLFPPLVLGGYERACANVARAMIARGHDVLVMSAESHLPLSDDEPEWLERSLDLNWYFLHKSTNAVVDQRDLHAAGCSIYGNTLRFLKRLQSFEPDIVYVWNSFGLGAAALLDLLNCADIPWAMHLMDRVPTDILINAPAPVLGLFGAQDSGLYARARVFAMSEHLLDEIEATCGVTFPQGVDLVPGWADLSAARPHWPYLRDGLARFVTAGTVAEFKGIDLILQAAARLKAEDVAVQVDIFGPGDIPGYLDKAHALQVADSVRFLGPRPQPELIRLYAEYDAFLFPTWEREPFGFAPIEAAGCGTPPLVTANCGASERLVDGVHCLKIERTIGDLTDSMGRVANGQVNLARMGRAGHNLVSTDLSLGHCVDQIETALQAHCRPWSKTTIHDPKLPLLLFLKHNMSLNVRFG